MYNISLTKISMVVIAATFTTLLVSANDDIVSVSPSKDMNAFKVIKFSDLAAQFDTDKNGLLSQSELKASNNEALHIAFNKLDINTDANISEQEFAAFINK